MNAATPTSVVPARRAVTGGLGILALAAGCYQPSLRNVVVVTDLQRERAASHVDSIVVADRLPSLVATVSHGRSVVFEYGAGYADMETGTAADGDTQFRVGSLSKLLTAAVLMRLSQTNALDLDAPLSTFVEVPTDLGSATLRQIAGHLAGVRHYRGGEFFSNTPYARLTDALDVFVRDSLLSAPGDAYHYSSYGYVLLGVAIERITELDFPAAVRRHVVEPLSLGATVPDLKGTMTPHRATLYSTSDNSPTLAPEDDLSGRWPSGGYLSSTRDLARFGRSLLTTGLLDEESLKTMFSTQRTSAGDSTGVGMGWRIAIDKRGRRYYHHGGSSIGGRAFLLIYPDEQLVVALACNAYSGWGENEALRLAEILLPDEE